MKPSWNLEYILNTTILELNSYCFCAKNSPQKEDDTE